MVGKKPRVLIVDDEPGVCNLLNDELTEQGYLCATAFDRNDALAKLATQDFDVALLDIRLPGISGIELLRKIRLERHNTATIMITAVNDLGTAVEAMKLGASDYIVKPFALDRIDSSVRTLLETRKQLPERRTYQGSLYLGGEEDKRGVEESFGEMNAIAFGVEVSQDLLDGHSEIVTQRTIDLARQLGIAEPEINKWVTQRARLDAERRVRIKSMLNKLERSLLAQIILGMTELYGYTQKSGESEN